MKEENINGSLVDTRLLDQVRNPVKKHTERRVKLNDTYIRKLKRKSKLYSIGDSEMVGLRLYVQPSSSKTFYYAYRPKNEKNFVRYKIGTFNVLNVQQARNKAKKYVKSEFHIQNTVDKWHDTLWELTENYKIDGKFCLEEIN